MLRQRYITIIAAALGAATGMAYASVTQALTPDFWDVFFSCLVSSCSAVAAYHRIGARWGERPTADHESHCRVCGYILRGITEPRCPECGERI